MLMHAGHPYEPTLAVSGIDSTIKIFSPDRKAQRDARLGINLGGWRDQEAPRSSLRWPRAREHRRRSKESEPRPLLDSDDDEQGDPSCGAGPHGLASRRRMHESYQIISQNDVDRVGDQSETFLTVSGPAFPLRAVPMDFGAWIAMLDAAAGADLAS